MADQLKFVDSHNIDGYLLDPLAAHDKFKSMILGLNNCRISHALCANPLIYKDQIIEFLKNASINRQGSDGVGTVESMVKGTLVIISEQVIREVLKFGDPSGFPIKYPSDQVKGALQKM